VEPFDLAVGSIATDHLEKDSEKKGQLGSDARGSTRITTTYLSERRPVTETVRSQIFRFSVLLLDGRRWTLFLLPFPLVSVMLLLLELLLL
jgi:hypothetical protein